MRYYVRLMRKEDIPQVSGIDREAFPTQWPPPDYRSELQYQLAHYIVVCEEGKTAEEAEVKTFPEKSAFGIPSWLKRWFNHHRISGNELSTLGKEYILGFAGMWIMADEAHLTNIAMRKRYQRQGIGELLLISIIDLATELKANTITLEVRVSNDAAQSLYRKYGLTQVGLRRGYYTDNKEDGILMSTESITSALFREHLQWLKEAYFRKYGVTPDQLTRKYPIPPGSR